MALAQITPLADDPRQHFLKVDRNFLGSGWSFYVRLDGKAFWIHKTGTVLPSSRNQKEEK